MGAECIEKRKLMGMIMKPTEFKMNSSTLKATKKKESFPLAGKCQGSSDAEYYFVAMIPVILQHKNF